MIRVHYSLDGQSFGRSYLHLSEALSFVEDNAISATVVVSDGVHVVRRFTFKDGTLTGYEINRNGRMVDLLTKENCA